MELALNRSLYTEPFANKSDGIGGPHGFSGAPLETDTGNIIWKDSVKQ